MQSANRDQPCWGGHEAEGFHCHAGLTFDSGGYNIKAGPGSMIELMKFDMGGAGATLGAAKAIGAIQPEGVEVRTGKSPPRSSPVFFRLSLTLVVSIRRQTRCAF